ncbi:hypothetical protein OG735_28550 [Streptomyces sp. NBC_01210]|uniref:hypothetical protein n=1 Tax=Streptomyces sp. NBC_01210 TaxID=2903774 RepID=UPI002E15A354|nr:hypothetical protein OG735_28550 [Streptomyces sp. NBC_01210]
MQTWRDGRTTADDATNVLREALAALGVPESTYRSIRPMVTHSGKPYVHLGMIRAEHVEHMAEAIRSAVARRDPSSAGS